MRISGHDVEIRPIEPSDKASLADAVEQSSQEAIYRRFLSPHGRLTASELRYLTEVDHSDHEALMAVDRASGRGVGVARYVRDRERPECAEIAVSVLETGSSLNSVHRASSAPKRAPSSSQSSLAPDGRNAKRPAGGPPHDDREYSSAETRQREPI